MLEIRPNCECCDKDLPASATDAMICSYECTFCRDCVEQLLLNVCPNCAGGFTPRPIRPATARREGVSLSHQPAADKRVNTGYSQTELHEFAQRFAKIPPDQR